MGRNNDRDEESLPGVEEKTALGRLGSPADVVGPVSVFAFEDADVITGQTPNVEGGIVFH